MDFGVFHFDLRPSLALYQRASDAAKVRLVMGFHMKKQWQTENSIHDADINISVLRPDGSGNMYIPYR